MLSALGLVGCPRYNFWMFTESGLFFFISSPLYFNNYQVFLSFFLAAGNKTLFKMLKAVATYLLRTIAEFGCSV